MSDFQIIQIVASGEDGIFGLDRQGNLWCRVWRFSGEDKPKPVWELSVSCDQSNFIIK